MKTLLSLEYLLKSQDENLFVFQLNEKGELDSDHNPFKFTSFRRSNFCSDVVDTIEDKKANLIVDINKVMTKLNLDQVCKLISLENDATIWYYDPTNSSYLTQLSIGLNISFSFLISNDFYVETKFVKKYLE